MHDDVSGNSILRFPVEADHSQNPTDSSFVRKPFKNLIKNSSKTFWAILPTDKPTEAKNITSLAGAFLLRLPSETTLAGITAGAVARFRLKRLTQFANARWQKLFAESFAEIRIDLKLKTDAHGPWTISAGCNRIFFLTTTQKNQCRNRALNMPLV